MNSTSYPCGCVINKDLDGNLIAIIFCPTHQKLFSPDKTLNQMYEELMASPDFLDAIHLHRLRERRLRG